MPGLKDAFTGLEGRLDKANLTIMMQRREIQKLWMLLMESYVVLMDDIDKVDMRDWAKSVEALSCRSSGLNGI